MLDSIQIPILLKAVDFVFEEGRKILAERRERRQMETQAPQPEPVAPEKTIVPADPEQAEALKQELRTSKVDELLWKNHAAEVEHLVRLLDTHTKNYRLASEQYAKWGSALVPPIVVNNLTEAENAVLTTTQKLEDLLAKLYPNELQPPK